MLFFLFFIYSANSQNEIVDSLRKELSLCKQDTTTVLILNQLGSFYIQIGQYDSAFVFEKRAAVITRKVGYLKGLIRTSGNLGLIYLYTGNNSEALNIFKGLLKLGEVFKDSILIGKALNSIGNTLFEQGNYTDAQKYFLISVKIGIKLNDKISTAIDYQSLGNCYVKQGRYAEGLKYLLLAGKYLEEGGDKLGVAGVKVNVGNIFNEQGDFKAALKHFSEALRVGKQFESAEIINGCNSGMAMTYYLMGDYQKSVLYFVENLKLAEKINNKTNIAAALSNIGSVYKEFGKYDEALSYFSNAIKVANEIGDVSCLATAYYNSGIAKLNLNKALDGKQMIEKALGINKEIGTIDGIKYCYRGMSIADSLLGNYKEAFKNYKLYVFYRDSLFNEEATKKIVEVQMQSKFDKKQTADSLKAEEVRLVNEAKFKEERTQRFALYGGLIIVLAFSIFIFNRFKVTQKQKQIIESQKVVVEEQKYLVEEKHKEITDSINYAERIQRSFMATKEMLDNNLHDYFVLFKPKDVVSGDFYWSTVLSNGNFILATADSTGHGVPGAIMSLLNITSLEKAIEKGASLPSTILQHTRETIIERLKKDGSVDGGKDGMDCSLCMYDFSKLKLYVSSANNPVWIVRQNASIKHEISGTNNSVVIEIKADKMPVGKHDKQNSPFTLHEIQLQKGDVVYTLTDGYPDQFGGEKGKKFLSKNLREMLLSNSHLLMTNQKNILEDALKNWIGNLEQVDDITVIGIRV